ncbi:MAG: fumarylacetoacetate hydrolase family protein [Haloechinothrix sp.]
MTTTTEPARHPLGVAPSKIIAVHLNYLSRARERGRIPEHPSYFLKPPSSLSVDGTDIVVPRECSLLTFEGEIAIVMGTRAHRVPLDDALSHVAGYAAANDVGVYDLRACDRGSNLRAKGQDGFTPVGSTLLDARAVAADSLVLRTYVNGELRQDTGSDQVLFPFAQLVADLSRTMTLEPGDLILTGTPTGSTVVRPGDTVEVELVGAGRVRNRIVQAVEPLAHYGAMPEVTDAERVAAYGGSTPAPRARNAPLRPDTAAKLNQVGTATLSSQLRKHGIEHHVIAGVRPARPDLRLLGFARTLRYLPLREDVFAERGGAGNAQKVAVDTLEPGEVLVIDARQEHGAGTIGDILVLRALHRAAAGVVSDGGLRDKPAVRELDIPTYYAASHAAVLGRKHVPMDMDIPVACGGVLVMPGDVLVGDGDGVVVIPRDLVDEIAERAVQQELEERFIAERVRAGDALDGLYPMDVTRREQFAAWLEIHHNTEEPGGAAR